MTQQLEAMKLALDALETSQVKQPWAYDKVREAITEMRKAIEQAQKQSGIPKIGCVNHDCDKCQQAQKQEPLDMPLPCDVKVGHVTMRKGVALSTLVARMQVLYDMAQGQAQKQERCRKEQRGNGEYVCNCKSGECPEFGQQKQEPVATVITGDKYALGEQTIAVDSPLDVGTVLYTSPPQRQWVGLTDEQIQTIAFEAVKDNWNWLRFARAIVAAHGITGEQK